MNETVCSAEPKCILIGLLLVDALMNDVDVGNHLLGFFTYNTYILQFKRQLLEITFFECHRLFLLYGALFLNQQMQSSDLLELCLQIICKLLEFPFDPNYATFNSDMTLLEMSQTNYPPNWYPSIRCETFLGTLVQVSCSQHSSFKMVRSALTAFNAVLAARPEGRDTAEVERIACIAVDTLPRLCCLLQRRLGKVQNEAILEILSEQITRVFKWFKVSKLLRAGPERFNLWIQAVMGITEATVSSCPEVESIPDVDRQ